MVLSGPVHRLPGFQSGGRKPEVAMFDRIQHITHYIFRSVQARVEIPTAILMIFRTGMPIAPAALK